MISSKHFITLDLQKQSTSVIIPLKRGETGKQIVISLADGGFPYTITSDCYAVLTAEKPDGNVLYNHCTIDRNTIIYDVTEQTTAVVGTFSAAINLYGADDTLLVSAKFRIIVDGTIFSENDVLSEPEMSALTHLISEASTIINLGNQTIQEGKDATKAANEATQSANEATQNATVATDSANKAAYNANQATTDAEQATEDANNATANANTAASNANAVVENANRSAVDADASAERANTAADSANLAASEARFATEKANSATANANVATSNANKATDNANTAASNAAAEAGKATQATEKANLATTNANNAASDARTATNETNAARENIQQTASDVLKSLSNAVFAPGVVCEDSGEVIAVADSSDRMVQGLRVFGRTVQDGTPTPDAPVELVSVGNSGSVGLTVAGKNLLPYPYYETTKTINGITFTDNGDGTITADGTATADAYFSCARDHKTEGLFLPKGTYTISGCPVGGSADTYALKAIDNGDGLYGSDYGSGATGTAPRTASCTGVVIRVRSGVTVSKLVFKPQIERGTTATDYEPYTSQIISLATPNGLPGIPVTSGGNYTDESGQAWICDEVDFARGVYVQRATQVIFDGSEDEGWGGYLTKISGTYRHGTKLLSGVIVGCATPQVANGFCTHYPFIPEGRSGTYDGITGIAVSSTGNVYIYDVDCDSDSLSAALKEKLASNPITCLFQLVTPIETPIPAEELAAYAALHTNKPNTTLHNDAGVHMELSYVADTKLYIDNKIAAIAAAVLNNT